MAASIDDLIATMSGGMAVGQRAQDLKELHAKLAQTLQSSSRPVQRPIPPTTKLPGPHSAEGPLPPPAPVSSWNDAAAVQQPVHLLSESSGAWSSGMGNSPRQRQATAPAVSNAGVPFTGKRTTGFTPPPADSAARPHHDDVLPSNASPIDTGGFAQDAFRPLWDKQPQQSQGFAR